MKTLKIQFEINLQKVLIISVVVLIIGITLYNAITVGFQPS